jgi:hypothetical protein
MIIHPYNGIPIEKWTRPQCWPSIPYISVSEQVVYIPFAVYNDDSNYFAITCRGAYTVDTGDGTVTNVADNTKFEYKFTYANVSKTCIRGYKVALIKITPQAGQNLTSVTFQVYHSAIESNKYSNVLEIVANLPNGSIVIGGSTVTNGILENIDVRTCTNTTFANLFYNCINLKNYSVITQSTVNVYTTAFTSSGLNTINITTDVSGSLSSAFSSLNLRVVNITGSMGGVTVTTSLFGTRGNLSKIILTGLTIGFSVASQKLSASALNDLADSLGTANGAQIINISGNIGTNTCDQTKFTNKGYTLILV